MLLLFIVVLLVLIVLSLPTVVPIIERFFMNDEQRLKADVRLRRSQAEKRDLPEKAKAVARNLTKSITISEDDTRYVYNDQYLELAYICNCSRFSESASFSELTIHVGTQKVFGLTCDWSIIACYIPGEWEDHLTKLAVKATEMQKQKEGARRNAELDEKRRQFGL